MSRHIDGAEESHRHRARNNDALAPFAIVGQLGGRHLGRERLDAIDFERPRILHEVVPPSTKRVAFMVEVVIPTAGSKTERIIIGSVSQLHVLQLLHLLQQAFFLVGNSSNLLFLNIQTGDCAGHIQFYNSVNIIARLHPYYCASDQHRVESPPAGNGHKDEFEGEPKGRSPMEYFFYLFHFFIIIDSTIGFLRLSHAGRVAASTFSSVQMSRAMRKMTGPKNISPLMRGTLS